MIIEWDSLGERILEAGSSCTQEAILVAPFVKSATLRKVVEKIPGNVPIVCITRWRLEEIASGVSDLGSWDIISERRDSRMYLLPQLHAKYYRFDDQVFLGSANVTMTALGWNATPNFEVLIAFRLLDTDVLAFERALTANAVEVTEHTANEFKALAEQFMAARSSEKASVDDIVSTFVTSNEEPKMLYWVPKSRSPELLFQVYSGKKDVMSRSGLISSVEDLRFLDLPPGLSEPAFIQIVKSRLLVSPIILKLDEYLTVRRRFGEIRAWLKNLLGIEDATDQWQCLMRWLLVFMPTRYRSNTPGYSELFWRE